MQDQAPKKAPLPILRKQTNWKNLYFYRKGDVLYQLTVTFCRQFLPKFGDRTVDQMVQAARSGKQNIVEGFADGVTSTEMELKLLNVGRASFRELREDYADFLKARKLPVWNAAHPRYDAMLAFCRDHNDLKDYQPLFGKMDAEALLCFQLPFNSSGVVVQVPSTATVHVQEKRTGRPSGLEYRIVIAPVRLSFERE